MPEASIAPAGPAEQYVITEVAEERLAGEPGAEVTNRVYRGQAVKVYETLNGWARVSEYYDGGVEGQHGRVARWIESKSLASERPAAAKALSIPKDPRIELTRIPGEGLDERDVLILHAAARYYLETKRATRVEFGDKSVSKPGVYYLNFGEPQNTFFRPSSIPNLEERVRQLQR